MSSLTEKDLQHIYITKLLDDSISLMSLAKNFKDITYQGFREKFVAYKPKPQYVIFDNKIISLEESKVIAFKNLPELHQRACTFLSH